MPDNLFTNTEFVSAIVGAVVGAAGGGVASYFVQMAASRSAARQAVEAQRMNDSATARGLIFKLIRLNTDLERLSEHLAEGAITHTVESIPLWCAVKPLANTATPLFISAHEMSLMFPLKDDKISNLVMSVDATCNACYEIMDTYKLLRRELGSKLRPAPLNERGGSSLHEEDIELYAGRMYELDDLLSNLIVLVEEYAEKSNTALYGAHRLLSEKYELHFELERPVRPPIKSVEPVPSA